MCMDVLSTCVQYLRSPEEGVGFYGAEVTDSCELSCGYWKLNLGSLGEHPVSLTAKPFLGIPFLVSRMFLKTKIGPEFVVILGTL